MASQGLGLRVKALPAWDTPGRQHLGHMRFFIIRTLPEAHTVVSGPTGPAGSARLHSGAQSRKRQIAASEPLSFLFSTCKLWVL